MLALALAGVFAALGQWQLERSVAAGLVTEVDTETVVPLDELAEPQTPVTGEQAARLVSVAGRYVAEDAEVLPGRVHEGRSGAWLVGHLVTDDGVTLAVALGWAPDADAARAAAPEGSAEVELTGRYLPSESPTESDPIRGTRALAVPELINIWPEVDTAYAGYLVVSEAPAGLSTIDAPPPSPVTGVNWLNLFYAVEWALFAGFALYLWYRVVRDVVEAEAERAGAAAGAGNDARVAAPAPEPPEPRP